MLPLSRVFVLPDGPAARGGHFVTCIPFFVRGNYLEPAFGAGYASGVDAVGGA
jgi:hypothetical protein